MKDSSGGEVPSRFFVRLAGLEMHPLDTEDRAAEIKELGSGYCNITTKQCCTFSCCIF